MLKQHARNGSVRNRGNGRQTAKGNRGTISSAVKVGLLVGMDQAGVPLVDFPNNPNGCLPAQSTVPLSDQQVGQEVALMFADGDLGRPLIMGVLQKPQATSARAKPLHARVDGETITFAAEKEIVLQCGEATIKLTRDGKVTIRGTYLLSRSSGVNRIQGGSIELN